MANKKTSKPQGKAAQNKNSVAGKRSEQQPKAAGKGASSKPAPPKTRVQNSNSTNIGKSSPGRTASGKVPQGRTLTTRDKHLDKNAKEPEKERPVVVIEANDKNELAVVQLSSRDGKDRTRLKNYQQGQSRFKHYVEIEDSDGKPIKVNAKFKENHPNMDVSRKDVKKIVDKVLNKSKPAAENRKKMDKFRGKKSKKIPRN